MSSRWPLAWNPTPSSMLLKKHYDALKHLKEANVNAELLLQQRPDAYDAYVALGCANYIIGSLPGSARFMLWFGGIHGDKRLGMEQVQKTVDGGRYLKPFAQILLALSARREKQDALAQKLLKDLTEEFPGNSVYMAEYEKALGRPIPASSARPNRTTRGRTPRVSVALDPLIRAPSPRCRRPAFWSSPLQFGSCRPSNKSWAANSPVACSTQQQRQSSLTN